MFGPKRGPEANQEFVFPDWSPYTALDEAARAYFRDPEVALEALAGVLGHDPETGVIGFTLERMVSDDGMVWQEAAVCDGRRLVLWHGEDVPDEEFPGGAMTSAVRTVSLSRVTEVGYRQLLVREDDGSHRVHGVDVYILLEALDEACPAGRDDDGTMVIRHDAIRLGKTTEAGGPGQMRRLTEFAHLVARLAGVPLAPR
jgi:hypothetical protein